MRKYFNIIFSLSLVLFFSSCIKNDNQVFTGSLVEFDATVLNSPAVGKTYPLLTRVPVGGTAVNTGNPSISRTSGLIKFRVNLVGRQRSSDQTINYTVVAAESTAVSGTHFTTPGSFLIPANSSFGEVTVNVLNTGVSSTTPVDLVLELMNSGDVNASANYRFLGIRIAQQ